MAHDNLMCVLILSDFFRIFCTRNWDNWMCVLEKHLHFQRNVQIGIWRLRRLARVMGLFSATTQYVRQNHNRDNFFPTLSLMRFLTALKSYNSEMSIPFFIWNFEFAIAQSPNHWIFGVCFAHLLFSNHRNDDDDGNHNDDDDDHIVVPKSRRHIFTDL